MVLAPGIPLADNMQQIPPFRVERIRRNFQTRPDMAQTSRETLAEAGAVFAEPVDTAAGEDQGGPAARIFDFLVAAPDCPISSVCGRKGNGGLDTFCFGDPSPSS
jgi:hypothetical protein